MICMQGLDLNRRQFVDDTVISAYNSLLFLDVGVHLDYIFSV
jgi:hypothetical protein